jgi:hypothetical protein
MTSDLQAIAIEQRWCQSCPSGNLPTAGPVPWLGGPALMRPPSWRELRRKTCVCGNLHWAGALGHVFACTAPDLRRSRKAFVLRRDRLGVGWAVEAHAASRSGPPLRAAPAVGSRP